jgi:multiple sugar transport system substrate-binding protein
MADLVAEAEGRYGAMLDLTRRSSLNPNTGKYYAYAPSWVPDPGDYRRSLWDAVGFPDGPRTYDDLLEGGTEIFENEGVQLGIGMSQEIDSNMALRALMWSFGAGIQDENENVIINSDATVAAVEYMNELFNNAMTPEVFAWNAASNNQGINSGELSYILNSISAYRTAQDEGLEVADDIWFSPALEGPETALVASHVMYNWLIPDFPDVNVSAAQEFLLHYTENLAPVAWHSKLYDFPAFPERVPDLDAWLDDDPFGSNPPDKLVVLKDSLDWATNVGHPGPANPAVGQIFGESIIPVMFAEAAQGTKTPAEAVADAEAQINAIFDNWRDQGLVGSG